jgi:hypothetical protein
VKSLRSMAAGNSLVPISAQYLHCLASVRALRYHSFPE